MKWHHAMADGMSGVAMADALLDGATPAPAAPGPWSPAPEPSELELLRDAIAEQLRLARRTAAGLRSLVARPGRRPAGDRGARSLAALGAGPKLEPSPLNTPVGPYRRFAMATLPWLAVRSVARAVGAPPTTSCWPRWPPRSAGCWSGAASIAAAACSGRSCRSPTVGARSA